MKKGKFLVGTALLSVALLGTGYAAWTQEISITSTVQTSNLKMEMSKEKPINIVEQSGKETVGIYNKAYLDYLDVTAEVTKTKEDNDTMNIMVNQLFPGAMGSVTFKAINKGSLASTLDQVQFDTSKIDANLKDHLLVRVGIIGAEGKYAAYTESTDGTGFLPVSKLNTVKRSDEQENRTVPVNREITIFVEIKLDDNAPDSTESLSNQQMSIALGWGQYNKVN